MKILTPLDQSHRDGIILPYSVRMAKALDATITVLHVVPITRSLLPRSTREAEAYLTATEAGLRDEGARVETILQRGDPATVIISLAEQLEVDMIVMTTRGRSGLGKLVLGSVADAVLSHCQKPVLLLSEAANGHKTDETVRLQSLYVATLIWQRQQKGVYTPEQAEEELDRLAGQGLDRTVLFETYRAHFERDASLPWLDIDFQLNTLRTFFPDALVELELSDLPKIRYLRAA